MKIFNFGYISLFLILLFGCSNYSNETKRLNSILSGYGTHISPKNHLYIVRSRFYCGGCIQTIYLQLENKLNKSEHMPITIISGNKKHISARLLSKVSFIADTLELTNREFPTYINLMFFETNNSKIIKFKNVADSKKVNLPGFVRDFIADN